MTAAAHTADALRHRLRRRYLALAGPAGAAILVLELSRDFAGFQGLSIPGTASLEIPVFVLAAATALALPILYRALFASAHRQRPSVSPETFYRFENNSTVLAMTTPYWAALAALFAFDAFFTAGIFLFTLYAAYVFYPSRRRIETDMRIFRVRA